MMSLMEKNPINRLFRLTQIKNNIWFNDFDWEGLINMNLEPAYKIKISDNPIKDTTPFTQFMEVRYIKID
jgi:hypothetical protein